MLCERCKKREATFYYHENVNGKEKSVSLCASCADELEKKGEWRTFGGFGSLFADDAFEPMDPIFGSLFAPLKTGHSAGVVRGKKCPLCGMSLSDFHAEGKAGCPTCYETFADELEPAIGRMQGGTMHRGKMPGGFREKNERQSRILALEEEKKEAIRAENYERAAKIRDELRSLRGNP